MLEKIKMYWKIFLENRRIARDLRPEAFRILAKELRELSIIASRLRPQESKFQVKVSRIHKEMDQLEELTSKPEFRMLPTKKRMQLRKSLINSKNQLLESVNETAPPTDMPQ